MKIIQQKKTIDLLYQKPEGVELNENKGTSTFEMEDRKGEVHHKAR